MFGLGLVNGGKEKHAETDRSRRRRRRPPTRILWRTWDGRIEGNGWERAQFARRDANQADAEGDPTKGKNNNPELEGRGGRSEQVPQEAKPWQIRRRSYARRKARWWSGRRGRRS